MLQMNQGSVILVLVSRELLSFRMQQKVVNAVKWIEFDDRDLQNENSFFEGIGNELLL